MSHCIDNSFKHSVHGKLGSFNPVRSFDSKNLHIFRNKTASLTNLSVCWAKDVLCINLVGCISFSSPITNRLDKCVSDVVIRPVRSHEKTSNCWTEPAIFIFCQQPELKQEFFVILWRKRCPEPLPQRFPQTFCRS